MSTYHIFTFGCQMNKSDSERIAAIFEQCGLCYVAKPEQADFLVVNACSVRQAAVDRIWGVTKKKKNKKTKLILTGCLLKPDQTKFEKKFDFVFNIKKLRTLKRFLRSPRSRKCSGLADNQVKANDTDYLSIMPKIQNKFQAYVPIMTGCDNYCAYCVVPYVRGGEISRSMKDILNEINSLARSGCKEICLLGQNVNSYNSPDEQFFCSGNPFNNKFAKLLWAVNKIKGIERINFAASHPKDIDDDIIRALALPKQVNYIHIALQSGDNKILKKMNRRYTVEDYYQIIKKIRQIKPNIAIGTDIIVGFPGETRRQFENTMKFYQKVKFDIAYISKYSSRAGTASATMKDNVPLVEKQRRWQMLQNLMEKIVLDKNQQYLGQNVSVLIDKQNGEYGEGNSMEMKRVRIYNNKKIKPGDIINVKITKALEWILIGQGKQREKNKK